MKKWAASLSNRSAATDVGRLNLHVLPAWRGVRVADVDLPRIMAWLDQMADQGEIGPGSRRHCLGLLSRFMSWAVARGHAPRNACRDIPAGSRPRPIAPPAESIPWVKDDDQAIAILRALPSPFDAVFFIGNRSGARLSEILSLRLSDLDGIDQGVLRIRYAGEDGAGWLKEAKHGPRTKYAPIPPGDARAVLGPILDARLLAGADPEAFVFVDQDGDRIDRHAVTFRWRKMREALGLPNGLNFYRATRHSAASRAQAAGASATEIGEALGHASPGVTLRHYMHAERRRFSSILTAGLGLDAASDAQVIPLVGRTGATDEAEQTSAERGDAHAA
ncbi:MAG TPA: site-specific integrase [Polyangia bacterium]|nr:site-specific integrase [Polyangia bacterium]